MKSVLSAGVLIAACITSGCASLGLDEKSDFSCKKAPGESYCLPASKIYELSEGDGDIREALDEEQRKLEGGEKEEKNIALQNIGPEVALPTFEQPLTLMNLPSVVRVYVGPYEDEKRNLYMPGYMMVKTRDWEWSVGEKYDTFVDANVFPLQIERKNESVHDRGGDKGVMGDLMMKN